MNQTANHTSLAERLIDSQPESFSFRDIISKIFLRPKMLLVSLLTPPIVAMLMSAVVPVEWSASTKILIRYSAADAGFLKNLVSEGGLGLSGATSVELIKSTPVLERTIDKVGIKEEDVFKTPGRVISNQIFGSIHALTHIGGLFAKKQPENTDSVQAAINRTGLVNSFKASLESSSKKTGSGQSVEILEKTSLVPESMKLDELITVQVKSFNREKVGDMANGLASAFIEEYYSIYAQEAKRQSEYLNDLISTEEANLKLIEKATPADLANGSAQINSGGRELTAKDVPILASLATELSVAEAALTKSQQIYAPGSAQVSRLSGQVANLKFMLKKQERIEISKQLVEQLKTKHFQALNTESVYKNKLVPIKIVELADKPGESNTQKPIRIITSGIIGLILGAMLAVSLMVVLDVLDPRVHFKKDVEKLVSAPVIGHIPNIDKLDLTDHYAVRNNDHVNQGIWQIITRIGGKNAAHEGKVIVISSPMVGDGATFCATALAMNLAMSKHNKVCLIDANFNDAGITKLFSLSQESGLIDALLEETTQFEPTFEDGRLLVIGTGSIARKTELGHYSTSASSLIESLKSTFDFIIIDSGSILKSNETLILSSLASEVIMVASSGVSRKTALKVAEQKLQAFGIKASGVIFNRSKEVLPEAIYRML